MDGGAGRHGDRAVSVADRDAFEARLRRIGDERYHDKHPFHRLLHSGGAAEAARIRAEVDTCDDLYGLAKGLPEDHLLREVLPVEEVPTEIALELAKLDEGESSTALGEGVFLMLCGRTSALSEDVSREQIRSQLSNQRLASYADSYLAELRAEAHIVYEDPSLRP